MRLHFILLLAAAAFANIDASSTRDLQLASANSVPNRMLRAVDTTADSEDSEDEERMNVPGLETVTNAIKSAVTKGKMSLWLAKGEDADDALKLLKLDDSIEKLRDSTNLNNLAGYVKTYNQQNPDHEVSLAAALVARYGDEETARFIQQATNRVDTAEIAKALNREQLKSWLTAKKNPDDVLKLLKLDNNVEDLLASPAVHSMVDFLNAYNKQHTNQHTRLMKVLRPYYKDPELAMALQRGVQPSSSKSVKDMAWVLKEAQFDDWIQRGIKPKNALAEVFGGSVQPWKKTVIKQFKKYYNEAGKDTFNALDDI